MAQYTKLAAASIFAIALVGNINADAPSKSLVTTDAQNLVDSSDLKVRYIDVFGAMRECKEGMQETEKLEGVRKDLAASIQTEVKKLETAMAKYKAEASTMNDAARAKKEQEINKMKRDYESTVQSSEEQMKIVMQQVTEQLAKEIEQAVVEIAKAEKLDAVVDRMTGRVVYVADKVDYTSKVVKAMNKNYDYKLANNGKSKASTTVASNKKASAAA